MEIINIVLDLLLIALVLAALKHFESALERVNERMRVKSQSAKRGQQTDSMSREDKERAELERSIGAIFTYDGMHSDVRRRER